MPFRRFAFTLPLRLRSLFRRNRVELDLDDELQFHLERRIEEHIARGLTPAQARTAALRDMDGLTQHKEECRDMRKINFIENTLKDLRYGSRVLAKSPGFTFVAVLTLALAIGANAVVFSILNALVLRPLNVPRAANFYGIQRSDFHFSGQSYLDYIDFRDRNRSFEDLAAYAFSTVGVDTGSTLSRSWIEVSSGNYFDVMGIQPYLGRFFHASDEHGPNSAPYIVLSYGYWHTHFQDDRGAVGRVIHVNKHPYTILGVTPPEFHGTLLFFFPDFYVPMVNQEQLEGSSYLDSRSNRAVFMVMGHLKPGVGTARAAADLNSIAADLAKTYPKEDGPITLTLVRPGLYGDFLGKPVRAFVTALMLLAGLILLAACANLGSLFAARAADRGREVALRLALGATRTRVLRQLLTEAVQISLMGGAVGILGSVVLLRAISDWQPLSRFPIQVPVQPDGNVYLVALLLALVSGLLFGIVPIRQVLRTDPYQVVKGGNRVTPGRRISVSDALLVLQVAICAVLVTSSLVAVRGLVRSLHAKLGFEPQNVMLANTVLDMAGYRGESEFAMQKRMIDAAAAIPGVDAVGMVNDPPLNEGIGSASIYTDETTDLSPSNVADRSILLAISPGYFQAAGTRLLAGRNITMHDDKDAPHVAVVNLQFARRMFGSVEGALGKHFKLKTGSRYEVIGVTEDGKYASLTEDPKLAVYTPLFEEALGDVWLLVRSNREPQQVATAMRGAIRNLDPGLPVLIQTWTKGLDAAMFVPRVATVALGVMGMMGALLAVTGIFGMASYSVSRRLRELGIRMALGARRTEVLNAGLGRAFKLLAFGSVAGLLLGILSARVLVSIVYQATPRDPVVLAGVVIAMTAIGLLATWIPAHRALRLDPVTLLREE